MVRFVAVLLLLHSMVGPEAHAQPAKAGGRNAVAVAPNKARPAAAPQAKVSAAPALGAAKTVQYISPPLNFDKLGYAEGLPNSHVTAIIQDRIGFIWFGTQEGLARYDGTHMDVYRAKENDTATLTANYITALALDATGKLWVGTAEHGVNLYDPATNAFTQHTSGNLAGSGVTAIVKDRKDRMWFALTGGGVNRFDAETQAFVEYTASPLDVSITAMDVDAEGNVWLGTAGNGFIRWNPDTGSSDAFTPEVSAIIPISPITSVLAASSGVIWLGSEGDGLISFEPKTRKFTGYRHLSSDASTLSADHVSVVFEDQKKSLWVGTTNGLNRMVGAGKFLRYQHEPNDPTSLAFPGVESLFQDAGGVMWVGGFTVGVSKFDEFRSRFGRYRARTHPVNSFFEDADGTVWVGTYHGGLYKYEWKDQRVTLYHRLGEDDVVPLESAWIAALHRDRRGTLWMALQGQGLVAFNTKTETFRRYLADPDNPERLPVETVWDIWEDAGGTLWLATWGGGLVSLDPDTETFRSFTTADNIGLTSDHIYTLYPDRDGKALWLGMANGGLVKFDIGARSAASAFRHKVDDPAALSSDDILTIHQSESGSLWLGTYGGGLNLLDPATGKVKRYTTSTSQLTSDVVFGILGDEQGRLWLSTNGGGLIQFDPKANTFLAYRGADGVQGNEFAQGAFMRSPSGKLYFGGVDGFNAFDPKDIARDEYVPPIVFTGLKVFGVPVDLPQPIWTQPTIKVSYSDSFEVQFAALSFADPGQNRYAYKLDGFDEQFIETDRPFATYTKLGGGKYTLRVRAANRHGVWNEAGAALELAVKPPFWRTWPAYIMYIGLLVAVILLVLYVQRQRVLRVMREGRLAVVERDLALTGAVQSGFLPEYNEVAGGRVRLFGFYRGADACSGDWWWHEVLGQRHIVLVGDVTGHGPGPAMVTAAVASAFRTLVEAGIGDLRQAVEVLHRTVLAVAKGKYTMTMAAFELDERTGEWLLFSAGAPPLMSLAMEGKHRVHFCAGTPLGTESTFEPGELRGKLSPGERMLLCTDGIPEIEMPNGQTLGMRRLAQMYEKSREQDLRDAATAIVTHADQIQGGKPQEDDWTFAIVEWAGDAPPVRATSELRETG